MAKGKKSAKDKGKKKSKKAKKEGPKKPKSGFMCFSQERRKSLKEEQPELSITDASKVIGKEWNELDDEGKAPYKQLAEEDKNRYQKEKADFDAAKANQDEDSP